MTSMRLKLLTCVKKKELIPGRKPNQIPNKEFKNMYQVLQAKGVDRAQGQISGYQSQWAAYYRGNSDGWSQASGSQGQEDRDNTW